jgi:protein-S-isoprenylcysteine O-methyltransferase Ste14
MLFIGFINQFQIKPEERILSAKFGQQYSDYCQRVRRWI